MCIRDRLEADYTLDVKKFIQAVQECDAKLAVVCTPNNPTGTIIPLADIEYICLLYTSCASEWNGKFK